MHDANVAPRRPMPNPKRNGLNEFVSCRRGTMLCSRHDIKTGASLRKYGEFCHGETALFEIIVQPRMTVLDIGANIGVHTVDLSHMVGEEGEVHAFEPQRLLFQLLCANVALNNCTNVFTHHAAAGAISGTVLVPSPELDRRDIPAGRSRAGPPAGELVTLMTIDSLDLRACHVIRLNVNGMEAEALRGAAATIARCRPILYLGNDREDRSAELIRLVQSHGYRLYWYLPRLYNENNFRADTENIFGDAMLVNMLCVPTEVPQSSLSVMREVIDPSDRWHQPKPDEPEPKRPRQHR